MVLQRNNIYNDKFAADDKIVEMIEKMRLTRPRLMRYMAKGGFSIDILAAQTYCKNNTTKTDKELRECLNYQKNK